MTLEPVLVLWSDPAADQILLHNIWSYFHYSKSTPLPSSTLHYLDSGYPIQGHEDTVVYIM